MTSTFRAALTHLGLAALHVSQAVVLTTTSLSSRLDALLAETDEASTATDTATVTPLSTRRPATARHSPRTICMTCGRPMSDHVMTEDGPACMAIGVPGEH